MGELGWLRRCSLRPARSHDSEQAYAVLRLEDEGDLLKIQLSVGTLNQIFAQR